MAVTKEARDHYKAGQKDAAKSVVGQVATDVTVDHSDTKPYCDAKEGKPLDADKNDKPKNDDKEENPDSDKDKD
jgi:hypothetical protein